MSKVNSTSHRQWIVKIYSAPRSWIAVGKARRQELELSFQQGDKCNSRDGRQNHTRAGEGVP